MLNDAQLPPREGYVEVEDDEGKRIYQEIPDHPAIIQKKLEEENKLLRAQLAAQTERADFVEDCMAEMAAVVYP